MSDEAWVRNLDDVVAGAGRDYGAVGVNALALAEGHDPWTATVLVCEAGGVLEPHLAGRDQIFLPLEGQGWLEIDGVRREIEPGTYGLVRAGQLHAKGAITRLVVLVLQSATIEVAASESENADGAAHRATPSASSQSGGDSPR
jgi:quercetin dioxygenase-like cupin family protein